jgi:hypothetical protein
VGKAGGKRLLGRRKRRGEDNINMNLREIELGCMDWIDLAQGIGQWLCFVYTVTKLRVPVNVRELSNS